jgi:riboflavin biosynthesis pyrimidine reductase
VDRVVAYVAPRCSAPGRPRSATAGVGTISDGRRLQVDDVARTGEDVRLVLRPEQQEG